MASQKKTSRTSLNLSGPQAREQLLNAVTSPATRTLYRTENILTYYRTAFAGDRPL
jgi:hypothetical protein